MLSPLATLGIVFVVAVFALLQREDLRDRLIRLVGSDDLHRTTLAIDDGRRRLSEYFVTQLCINSAFGLIIGIGLFFIGVPNPVLWGILSALLRFVPYVGSFIAAVLPLGLAAAVEPGWSMVIWTAVLYVVVEGATGQVIEPLVYGHSTGLSPFSVVVAAIFWSWLWGPIGLILSTPLTLCLVVMGRHVKKLEFLDVMLGDRAALTPDRHLRAPGEMTRLFRDYPEAVVRTVQIAERCTFSLTELRYQYPDELEREDETPQQGLERLMAESLPLRYPEGLPPGVDKQLRHELALIARLDYAPYFLTVNSIVRYARSKGILCQGRGSAANRAVCYVLGVTAIDPVRSGLLFERFISAERREPPDIDVDFESERREEVIQWVYERYGRDRAALCATAMCFGARGAIRDVGKVMGLTEDVTGMLASQVWGWSDEGVLAEHAAELNLNLDDRRLRLSIGLARELIGFPRQLGTHPGGFVLTSDRLDELVPVEPAAMAGRQVIEWDKDDIDALKWMKVDVLGLGMLGCMRRAFDLLAEYRGLSLDIATIPAEDPKTYAMIRRADTLGTFQIESRAQMSMLPRLKPTTFYDLVVQVAIVRPGPIQGDMVHPYLRRREGTEPVHYPKEELERVLGKTLACPCFRSRPCRWPSTAPGSPRTKRTSCGGAWRPSSSPAGCRTSGTSSSEAWWTTATSGSSRSGPSASWRASAATASPRAMPPRSPWWRTPAPG